MAERIETGTETGSNPDEAAEIYAKFSCFFFSRHDKNVHCSHAWTKSQGSKTFLSLFFQKINHQKNSKIFSESLWNHVSLLIKAKL